MNRQFDDILLGSIELFCLAAEAGTFTGAANTAGVTPAAVSRSISRLEKRLGVRLFVRSTRSIRLTEGGKSYFEQSRAALNQLIEAERKVTGEQIQPSGTPPGTAKPNTDDARGSRLVHDEIAQVVGRGYQRAAGDRQLA